MLPEHIFFAGSIFRFLVLVGNLWDCLVRTGKLFRQEWSPWYIPVYNRNCKTCNVPFNFRKYSWLWLRVFLLSELNIVFAYGQGVPSAWLACNKSIPRFRLNHNMSHCFVRVCGNAQNSWIYMLQKVAFNLTSEYNFRKKIS